MITISYNEMRKMAAAKGFKPGAKPPTKAELEAFLASTVQPTLETKVSSLPKLTAAPKRKWTPGAALVGRKETTLATVTQVVSGLQKPQRLAEIYRAVVAIQGETPATWRDVSYSLDVLVKQGRLATQKPAGRVVYSLVG